MLTRILSLLLLLVTATSMRAQTWTGNMAVNPGFEEDFVNVHAEGHVLAFKGDFYYNQRDNVPDYWQLKGSWTWTQTTPHSGKYSLQLASGATASQSFQRGMTQEGGGAWGGVNNRPIQMTAEDEKRFARAWKVTAWCRGGGKLSISAGKKPVSSTAPSGEKWEKVEVLLPATEVGASQTPAIVTLEGPGEFDDVVVQEQLSAAPNLISNSGFEKVDKTGYPLGWSKQKKWRAIGPTYYVWTDWNHFFSDNRGGVVIDRLVAHSGQNGLRFDVPPGDEKFVESDLILLNQDQAHPIEVGVWVRADRINLLDIRCVDEEGVFMPSYRPRQPENLQGGTFLYGNGTFVWRYVRKFFGTPQGRAVKGIRVRLCARGMNGHTPDDAGTRSFSMCTGTVWWDDLHVCECTTTRAEQEKRGVQVPPVETIQPPVLQEGAIDLGERLMGLNQVQYRFKAGKPGDYLLKLTRTIPGSPPLEVQGRPGRALAGQQVTLSVGHTLERPVGQFDQPGTLKVEVLLDAQALGSSTYLFHTWPVKVDFDVSRHYNLPEENPVTVSMNVGVTGATLARVARLELQLYRPSEDKVLAALDLRDPPSAFAATRQVLPTKREQSYEFKLPIPSWWVDRTNLIITKVDLSPLKIWPHDQPTRDTVLILRGLDAMGKEVFRDQSEPFCRMAAPPQQPPIEKVEVRQDGVVLINGTPRYLTGATHQSNRITHTPEVMAQLGLMGHRLSQQMTFQQQADMWARLNLYSLQIRPGNKIGGTTPLVDLDSKLRAEFEAFVKAGGMQNVVSVNTGGWEATINVNDPEAVKKHAALNEYIRQVSQRPTAISTSGAYNAWWLPKLHWYDINHAETEMWGPMDFNVIFTPYMKRLRQRPTAWVYLPQLYDNTPYERYRFETYENIIRGSAGVSMIQGLGDPTFNRGLAGELRYLEKRLTSLEKTPPVTLEPPISHKIARHQGKTYILATNAGPVQCGKWIWNTEIKHSGKASHEGDSVNQMWVRPGGVRIHGFRGLPMPSELQKGDKIVQHVWLDPKETPQWLIFSVRGDGKFVHNLVLGKFAYETFRKNYGNVLMFSELEHSVWHDINYVFDEATYQRTIKVLGQKEADRFKKAAEREREKVDGTIYQPGHFAQKQPLPKAGQWVRLELDAEKFGLVGKLVDGFAFLTKAGRALWDYTALERNGKVVRVFCEDSVGIERTLLKNVKINVPGLKAGTKIRPLFETRTITAQAGHFLDNFEGVDSYGLEAGGVVGDMFGYVKDEDRELPRLIPSGYGYSYGPTAVRIYEIEHPLE